MRRNIIALLAILATTFASIDLFAQSTQSTSQNGILDNLTAGPFFTGGASKMNEKVPQGWHSDPVFCFSVGGEVNANVMPWMGLQLGLAYDTRGLYMGTSGDSISADVSLDYFSIVPAVRIFWLVVGMAFDIPMGGSATLTAARLNPEDIKSFYQVNRNVANEDISTQTELRASLDIPISQSESGVVHLLIGGAYPLNPTLKGTSSFDSTSRAYYSHVGEGPLPSAHIGLTYQFDLNSLK